MVSRFMEGGRPRPPGFAMTGGGDTRSSNATILTTSTAIIADFQVAVDMRQPTTVFRTSNGQDFHSQYGVTSFPRVSRATWPENDHPALPAAADSP